MLDHRLILHLIVVGVVAFFSVCYIGYREYQYQKHVEFEAFMAKVQASLDTDTNPPEQTEANLQGKAIGVPATAARQPIDISVPPIQVGVHSREVEAKAEPVDWSEVPPEVRAKLEKFDDAPMKLQRIQTPNGNVHFIELPAGIDYSEAEITVSEEMAKTPTFPPTGSFPEILSVRVSDIPEGDDVEEYIYKKRWALFLGVSVEEVGEQMERGHLPPRPHHHRADTRYRVPDR